MRLPAVPDAQRLVLEFPMRSVSGERLDPVRQEICCYWRQAHYGGRYLMFLCKCGRSGLVPAHSIERAAEYRCRSAVVPPRLVAGARSHARHTRPAEATGSPHRRSVHSTRKADRALRAQKTRPIAVAATANSHHSPRSSCCARGRSSAHMHHFVRDDVTFGRRGALWSRDAPILHRLLLHLLQHLNSPRP